MKVQENKQTIERSRVVRYVRDQKQPEKDTTAWIAQATGRIVCWFL